MTSGPIMLRAVPGRRRAHRLSRWKQSRAPVMRARTGVRLRSWRLRTSPSRAVPGAALLDASW